MTAMFWHLFKADGARHNATKGTGLLFSANRLHSNRWKDPVFCSSPWETEGKVKWLYVRLP